ESKPSDLGFRAAFRKDIVSSAAGSQAGRENCLDANVREVFQGTLDLIRSAFVAQYGLKENEATELERDLYVWFVRFCSRPGSPPPEELRALLLVACCRLAREYLRHAGIGKKQKKSPGRETPNSDSVRVTRSSTVPRKGSEPFAKAERHVTLAVAT